MMSWSAASLRGRLLFARLFVAELRVGGDWNYSRLPSGKREMI